MERFRKNLPAIFLLILLGAALIIWYAVFHFEARQNLLVTFFDVGQGDAILIEVPNGNQILIDGGPGDRILSKLGRAMPFWDRSLDLLILTHPHADHLDGLLEALKRYQVDGVIESGASHSIAEYEEWKEILKSRSKKVNVVTARSGERVSAGSGVTLDILSPFENFSGESPRNPHDANVVTRLEYGATSILFMGDAERPLEYRLLFESSAPLDSDILKVGHHGSKTSSSEEFLRAVSPEHAVISVGRKNRYGHPHQEALEHLVGVNAKILRTDLDGDIRVSSDGRNQTIIKSRKR